jgi:hypothetical protein
MFGSLFIAKLFGSRRIAKAFRPLGKRNEMILAFSESKYTSDTQKDLRFLHPEKINETQF